MGITSTYSFDNKYESFHMSFVKERLLRSNPNFESLSASADIFLRHFALIRGNEKDYKFVAFTFFVPLCSLASEPPEITDVYIGLHSSMSQTGHMNLIQTFGLQLRIFSANLTEIEYVSWESTQNFCITSLTPTPYERTANSISNVVKVSSAGLIQSVSQTLSFAHADTASSAAQPISTPSKRHPLGLDVTMGNIQLSPIFPPYLNLASPLIQISRKSKSLTLTVSSLGDRSPDCFFPIYYDYEGEITMWGLSRIVLDTAPLVDHNVAKEKSMWLYQLACSQLSLSERDNLNAPIASFKGSIHSILLNFFGHVEDTRSPFHWIALNSKDTGVFALLFINGCRVDLTPGSVVIDAVACVLHHEILPVVVPFYLRSQEKFGGMTVSVTEEEKLLWKRALPAFNERCRDNWSHTSRCEYKSPGAQIPLSVEEGQVAVCSCCLGAELEGTLFDKLHDTDDKSVCRHFFRVAIPPLFPESGLYGSFQGGDRKVKKNKEETSTHEEKGKSDCCGMCGKESQNLRACSQCGKTKYCDQNCQKKHWKIHKVTCKK